MNTLPVLFLKAALLNLGKKFVEGQDQRALTEKATAIISYWHRKGDISSELRNKLFEYWQDLEIDVATRKRELAIRRHEGQKDAADVNRETYLCYVGFCHLVGDCLEALSTA
jgi:hypothetical protein